MRLLLTTIVALACVTPAAADTYGATRRADAQIARRVEAALRADPALTDSRISLQSVDHGVVVLAGTASNMQDHLRALADAARVPGVRRVTRTLQSPNELADAAPGTRARRDQPMTDAERDAWNSSATKAHIMTDSPTPALDIVTTGPKAPASPQP
jgi:BON domain